MNTKSVSLLLLFFLVTNFLFAQNEIPFKNFDGFVNKALSDWQVPGAAIAIVKDGKIVYAKGYGLRQIGTRDSVNANTVFAIASLSKAFTATALNYYAVQGKFSLNDKVTKHLPGFRLYDSLATQMITIRDLLSHHNGFGTFQGDFANWRSIYPVDTLIYKLRFLKPKYDFRTRYGYFNMGFVTGGKILENISGKSWAQNIKELLLDPLDMKRTVTSITEFPKLDNNIAQPHTIDPATKKLVLLPYRNIDNIAPCAALNSTANDLAHWLIFQMDSTGSYNGKKIMERKVINQTYLPNTAMGRFPYRPGEITESHLSSYALGWVVNDYHGRAEISHTGGYEGIISYCGFLPEEKLGVVVLTNTDVNYLIDALPKLIYDAYLKVPFKDWSAEELEINSQQVEGDDKEWADLLKEKEKNEKQSLELKAYCGTYKNQLYGTISIKQDKEKLVMSLQGHPGVHGILEHLNKDHFTCNYDDVEFGRFVFPFEVKDGKVKSVTVKLNAYIDPEEYIFEKMD